MAGTNEPPTLTTFDSHEIYPMPMFPTIAVSDVAAVSEWYQAALGFAVVFAAPGGAMVHLRRRKYQDVLIVAARDNTVAATGSLTVTFNSDGEIDALAARAQAAAPLAASSVSGPIATPWNTLALRDPAGHRLVFTARNPAPDPERAARLKKMFDDARPASE
jgi:catechol 2,3-dioxygenase-like lactoylglutathione lyase family enzyme